MEKLTNADINELTYWHSTPAPASVAGHLAAQSYDPRGSSTYDPTTDNRLANLVAAASSRVQSDWSRIKRIIDLVADGADGRLHVEILRRAFAPLDAFSLATSDFRYPEVAVVTRSALSRARDAAISAEHVRLLEAAQLDALRRGHTSMSAAAVVFATDAIVQRKGVVVGDADVRRASRDTLAAAAKSKTADALELCATVRSEMVDLVTAAGDAYRRARKQLGASRREAKEAAKKEREKLLDDMIGKKRAKESARFAAKLRRSA